MEERKITNTQMESYHQYLIREEKSTATVEKYLRDARAFVVYVGGEVITKEVVMAYKKELQIKEYAVRSINSMLASLNSLLDFLGWSDCKVKSIKQQKQVYCAEEKELSKTEYMRLLEAAKNKPQLQLVMQTICGTGIRVSELKFFTVENVKQGEVVVNCKGKSRTILIPGKLRKLLLEYSKKEKIHSGVIFLTRNGTKFIVIKHRVIVAIIRRICTFLEHKLAICRTGQSRLLNQANAPWGNINVKQAHQ